MIAPNAQLRDRVASASVLRRIAGSGVDGSVLGAEMVGIFASRVGCGTLVASCHA